MVNLDEFERLLLTNWTTFINPQKLISFILEKVRDSELTVKKGTSLFQKKSLQIKLSYFRIADEHRFYTIWVEFTIPKSQGVAIGTCELSFDPLTGAIEHLQTLGNILTD